MKSFYRSLLLVFFSVFLSAQAVGQEVLNIDIAGVGNKQIPIVIAGFSNEATASEKVTDIIKADLARTGMFRLIGTDAIIGEAADIDYKKWRAQGADALVVGTVVKSADGRVDVRYRLFDLGKSSQLSALSQDCG